MKIKTNGQYRLALYGYELPDSVKSDFDYVEDLESETFLLYKGTYYWIGDFMITEGDMAKDWDGYTCNNAFSGVLIKRSRTDIDSYLLATYY